MVTSRLRLVWFLCESMSSLHVEYVSHTIHRTVVNSSPKFLDEFLQEGFKGHLTWLVNFRIPLQKPNLFGESAHNEYIFSLAGKNLASALLYWMKVEISIGLLLTSGYSWMYPCPTYPYGKSLYKPYITWVFMGDNFWRIPRTNKNTMGTYCWGVQPISLDQWGGLCRV